MSFNSQIKQISLLVFSTDNVIRCNVLETSVNKIIATPIENKVDMFLAGYPVVCMYKSDNALEFRSGEVIEVDKNNSLLTINMTFDEVKEERRIFERYPVSIEVSARKKFSNKRFILLAKDLSEYGMGAVSKADLEIDEIIDMNLITGKYMLYFVGKVTWKLNRGGFYDYGFQLIEFDITTKATMAAYLGKLYVEYKKIFDKAK